GGVGSAPRASRQHRLRTHESGEGPERGNSGDGSEKLEHPLISTQLRDGVQPTAIPAERRWCQESTVALPCRRGFDPQLLHTALPTSRVASHRSGAPAVQRLRRSDDQMAHLGLLLLGAAPLGLGALTVMLLLTVLHVRRPALVPEERPGISVLKPLCGADDDLAANIASFVALPYQGDYEVLLGVRSPEDPAWPVAEQAVRRWPGRMRLVRQEREVGLNPKVNQLVGMARAARHDLLVISDSNIRVPESYLDDIAAHLCRPNVACVTHPIGGRGQRSLGALLDNVHLASTIATGMVAAHRLAGRELVVGKSMALWRHDLELLGGFESVANVLAED